MVIGDPIEHSLSPQIHNAGYEELKIDDQFVFVGCRVKISELKNFVDGVRTMGIRGISCTIPHKIEIMKYIDEIDDTAKKIGAVNTIVNDNGILKGYNTDWLGIVTPIEKIASIKNKTVAIIGAGGAARAAIYGIIERGGKVTIFNRTLSNAEKLAKEFGCDSQSLKEIKLVKNMNIIINTTSVGLNNKNESPVPKEFISNKHIVFDVVYNPYETKLITDAKEQKAIVIHGTEMLLHQAIGQFKLYTNIDAPEKIMKDTLFKIIK